MADTTEKTDKTEQERLQKIEVRNLDQDEVQEVLQFFKKYGTSITVAVVVGCAAYIGVTMYRNHVNRKNLEAAQLLARAQSTAQMETVARDYPNAPTAPIAELAVAADYYHSGKFDAAQNAYRKFMADRPDHPMKPAAELGQVLCLEAMGKAQEALAGYEKFLAAYPKNFTRPMAVFGKARALEQLGRFDEAKAVYEDFMAAEPGSPWVMQAESSIKFLGQARRAAARPKPAAPPAAPAAAPAPVTTPSPAPEAPAPAAK